MPHSIKYKTSSNSIFVHLSGKFSSKIASLERCRLRLCLLLSWTLFYSNDPVSLRQYLKLNFFFFMVKDDQKVMCGCAMFKSTENATRTLVEVHTFTAWWTFSKRVNRWFLFKGNNSFRFVYR